MPSRDRDDRPPIEVFGGAPDLASTQEIDVGGGAGSTRRWWLLVAVAVAVIAGTVAFRGGGDGGDRVAPSTTTTVRRTSSTVPTSEVPAVLGPLLPSPTGGVLVLAKEIGPWVLWDLDTGAQRSFDPLPHPSELYGGVTAVRGGLVAVADERATYLPILTDGPGVELGPAGSLVPSGDPDLVWLRPVDGSEVRLVDLRGRVHARVEGPAAYFGLATVDGLLSGAGGRVYLIGREGTRSLGVGALAGAGGAFAVVHTCDDDARCGPELLNTSTGERRRVQGSWGAFRDLEKQYHVMADGSLLEAAYEADSVVVRWVGPTGELLGVKKDPGADSPASDFYGFELGFNGERMALPNGLGVLWLQGAGKLVRLYPDGRGGIQVDQLPTPTDPPANRLFLVMP